MIFFKVFIGPMSILWGHWYPLFRTSDDSAQGFQSQDGLSDTCDLLSLAHYNPQSYPWLQDWESNPDHSPVRRARYMNEMHE